MTQLSLLPTKSDKANIKSLIECFFERRSPGVEFHGFDLLKFINNHGFHPYMDTCLRYARELKYDPDSVVNFSVRFKPDSLYRIEKKGCTNINY